MKQIIWFVFAGVFVLLLIVGCTTSKRVAELSVISTAEFSSLLNAQRLGAFEGKACGSALGGGLPTMEKAIDQVLEMGKGNAIIDAAIYYDVTGCTSLLPYRGCYRVEGIVIRTREYSLSSSLGAVSEILVTGSYDTVKTTTRNGYTYILLKNTDDTSHDTAGEAYVDLVLRIKE